MFKKLRRHFKAPILGWLLVMVTFLFCMPGMGAYSCKHTHGGVENHHHDDDDVVHGLMRSAEPKGKKTRDDLTHTHLVLTVDVSVCCPPECSRSVPGTVAVTMDLPFFLVSFPDEPHFEMIRPPQLG